MNRNLIQGLLGIVFGIVLAAANVLGQPQPTTNNATSGKVAAALEAVTAGLVGVVGVAAQDMAGGTQVFLNGDQAFPMASTYKIPIAVALLSKVDAGELSLTDMIEIDDDEWVYSQVIAANFIHQGVALSVANLLEVMITHSDNTATDVCLRLAGGPAAVNRRLAQLGIEGMRVDRSTGDLLRDFYGVEPGRENLAEIARIASADPGRVIAPDPQFEADPLDKSTPRAMLNLLTGLYTGSALSEKSTEFLLGTMARTVTMPDRLGGLLPRNTPVAHKTGTVGGVANDAGYITLPDGRRFAIVVFTCGSDTPPADRERAVAEVARTLYDYFLIHPANT
jgi:beta-lactamase class A